MNILEIVGLPGSGKTTLARILARKLGYAYFDVDLYLENPFLPLVAREPEKYALAAGLQFSLTRANRIVPLQKLSRRKNVVLDQGFHMGFYMYTKNHYAGTGILGEKEYKLLKRCMNGSWNSARRFNHDRTRLPHPAPYGTVDNARESA
jgi:deoxyadenosine/deoxycytidine kinase